MLVSIFLSEKLGPGARIVTLQRDEEAILDARNHYSDMRHKRNIDTATTVKLVGVPDLIEQLKALKKSKWIILGHSATGYPQTTEATPESPASHPPPN